jgi:hypothetical protein
LLCAEIGFDGEAKSMYNQQFSRFDLLTQADSGEKSFTTFDEVSHVRGHKNRRQTIQGCCWRKTQSRTDTG